LHASNAALPKASNFHHNTGFGISPNIQLTFFAAKHSISHPFTFVTYERFTLLLTYFYQKDEWVLPENFRAIKIPVPTAILLLSLITLHNSSPCTSSLLKGVK
jgi:hypothetical protein